MFDRNELYTEFTKKREQQAALNGRDSTPFDKAVGDKIFSIAIRAIQLSKDSRYGLGHETPAVMEAASIATGGGKSQSAYAFIAAAATADPSFTAAYVVPTVKMGIEAQQGIEALLGEGSTTLWTWCHKHRGRDTTKVSEDLGFVPERVIDRSTLPQARIVILTHKFLQEETETGRCQGAMTCNGEPRDVVFIDEHPELVEVVSAMPGAIQKLHDNLYRWDSHPEWLPVLSEVAHRMAKVMQAADRGFMVPRIVTPDEVSVFDGATLNTLSESIKDKLSSVRRLELARGYYDLIQFLRAASNSSCFYSKMDSTFFAYRLSFEPQPGFVLLDATADIAGLLELHPKIEVVRDVPQVNYENLDVKYLRLPKGFRRANEITKSHSKGAAYGRWIRRVVLTNTQPGDEVLIVTHKDVLGLHFVKPAPDINHPDDWEGRKVNTLHWGSGVGQNSWKHKTHVYLFSEFYPPRFKTVSETHSWSLQPPTQDTLDKAQGVKVGDYRYKPQGIYLSPHQGHLLRWQKQLAMRGSARNVDAQGTCNAMTLVVTTPLPDLLEHFERLFPGAPLPRPATKPTGVGDIDEKVSGRDGLIELLASCPKGVIDAEEVQRRTGIPPSKLTREVESENVQPIAVAYGWSLRSARELDKPGRMKYLVNERMRVSGVTEAA